MSDSMNTILARILADYENLTGKAPSAEVQVRASMLASCAWGLSKRIDYEALQRFPDTSDTVNLEHWCYVYGLTRTTGETDAALLARLLSRIRQSPAGGNAADYVAWALGYMTDDGSGDYAVAPANRDIGNALCYPAAQGPGTVDVVILLSPLVRVLDLVDDGSYQGPIAGDVGRIVDGLLPSDPSQGTLVAYDNTLKRWWVRCTSATAFAQTQTCAVLNGSGATGVMSAVSFTDVSYPALLTAASNYVNYMRPVAGGTYRVLGVTRKEQAVTMQASGNCDLSASIADITAHMNALLPGVTLYRSQLIALCIANGASNATFPAPETPTADVTATAYEVIRPITISVTAA